MEKWTGLPTMVQKRDGQYWPFNSDKIKAAIELAAQETRELDEAGVKSVLYGALGRLSERYPNHTGMTPGIEDIQDCVEESLWDCGNYRTARAYAVYREQRTTVRKEKVAEVDAITTVDEYLTGTDWRVKENSNQGYSLGGLFLNAAGKLIANYWLEKVYPKDVAQAHRLGDLHIHDLSVFGGYCAGWSLRQLLNEGFNGVPGRVHAGPPKHLEAAVGQMVNFMGTLQNEWAGAQAFSSVDTLLAPYIRVDDLSPAEVLQALQEFIYNMNVPSRWGSQAPFTNVTFDLTCPEDMKDQVPLIGGKEVDFTYGDLQEEMNMINLAFIRLMEAGDANQQIFTFPIPTYNITKNFDWSSLVAKAIFEMTAKYGLPYFQNFLNSDLKPEDIRSMCCRLQLDLRELKRRGNGLFGAAEQTGSVGVVTLNCARLGYLHQAASGDEADVEEAWEKLLARTSQLVSMGARSLEIKRKEVQKHMDRGLFPYTRRYLGTLRNHFSTIGVNGINEMILNFTRGEEDVSTAWGRKMAGQFLDHIRDQLVEVQSATGHMFNLEATPAEGTTYRFAKLDLEAWGGEMIQAGTPEAPYYTNSSQLPVGFTDDPFEALDLQEELQTKYTGGTVLHLYMGERISSGELCAQLVRKALSEYRVPYLTVTPVFSVCPIHGYLPGEHEFCPKCDEELLARERGVDHVG